MIDFRINISLTSRPSGLKELFVLQPVFKQFISNEQLEFIAWGDPIQEDDFLTSLEKNATKEFIIKHVYGHYYYFLLNKVTGEICIGNSMFGILPVYYAKTADNLYVSNSPFMKTDNNSVPNYNQRFLLENILFNYSLFNQSCISGTCLLPTNHYLKISNEKIHIQQHTAIEDYFNLSPLSWKKTAEHVAEQFIQTVNKYLPSEPYVSALTGGLDGRTLTACGLFYHKYFCTYSFGSEESEDVRIARKLSAKAGILYNEIRLDEEYTKDSSQTAGLSFINGAYGTASFSRAHYLYAAKKLAEKTKYLITGNFGSEVFRAAHIAGVVISPNLYRMLMAKNYDDAILQIENSPEWQWIEKASFSEAWESLKEDIRTLPCFDSFHKNMTKNQQFYKIVFDEVIRKYFGAEMVNQYRFLVNRTPFLDIDFLKAILGTRLAGVHSDFFTHNPFKRFKGQVLYAHIIEKTYPLFGKELLDKGYAPNDLLDFPGNIRIAFSWFNKKFLKQRKPIDPYAVNASFQVNKDFWKAFSINSSFFNKRKIAEAIDTGEHRDSLFIALSQAWFYNENFIKNKL